jgi:hypothetical protein
MWAKRQIRRAASQVRTNMPTITKPAVLRLKLVTKAMWAGSRLRVSRAPTKKQMATDRPVMARL